jgi:hypothetical protein
MMNMEKITTNNKRKFGMSEGASKKLHEMYITVE